MNSFLTSIKLDVLQRTRSYAFLITMCASLAIGYTFVPEPNANYSTIRIADHIGYYNSAWFGYVTAILTSVFLSLIGFYLVNSGIKTDIDTKVGHIIAASKINNFKYLFSKTCSNFIVLLTIMFAVFTMSILLFFLYNGGYSFELLQFIKPYLFITIPALFFIAVLAVVFEVLFGKYSVIQNTGFFFLFSLIMTFSPKNETEFSYDLFGTKIVMHQLEETVKKITNSNKNADLSIGYVIGNTIKPKQFEFNGMAFPSSFIISRFVWIGLGIGLIAIISPVFHRFNRKKHVAAKKLAIINKEQHIAKEISVVNLPKATIKFGVLTLLKTECLLLFRKGKKWLWLFNIIGMILLIALPLKIAHQMVLPILWFFQVSRLSDLTIKETINNVHYFTFTSYKPLSRLLFSQLLAGIVLILGLALPLLIRLITIEDFFAASSVLFGAVFIVLLGSVLGILTKGKKLFEVLFFMITYANINSIPILDYFGGFQHQSYYLIHQFIMILFLGSICFIIRNYRLRV